MTEQSPSLPVALDAMGGDHGPNVAVEGAVYAARELGISSIIVGDSAAITTHLRKLGAESDSRIQVEHAPEVITMDESPSTAIRGKPRASIRIAFELVKEDRACGVVSPGNTGAMMAAGLLIVGALPGIARPAIASLMPKVGDLPPTVFLDCGANIDCHAYQLVQFAVMGSCYALSALGCPSPRVGLLSNGTEGTKGNDITRSAAMTLSEMSEINFIGYVEGRDICRNVADVVVCDGFVGNIVLKAMEGCVELVFDSLRHYVERSGRGKIGLWLAKPVFKELFSERLDPSSYGGAPLLGLADIAIVCHGSSNGRAIMNGLRVARKFSDEGLIDKIAQSLGALDFKVTGAYENGIWNRMGQRFEKGRRKKAKELTPEPENKTEN